MYTFRCELDLGNTYVAQVLEDYHDNGIYTLEFKPASDLIFESKDITINIDSDGDILTSLPPNGIFNNSYNITIDLMRNNKGLIRLTGHHRLKSMLYNLSSEVHKAIKLLGYRELEDTIIYNTYLQMLLYRKMQGIAYIDLLAEMKITLELVSKGEHLDPEMYRKLPIERIKSTR